MLKLNPELVKLAKFSLHGKQAFVPSDAVAGGTTSQPPPPPGQGMPPPQDPSMMMGGGMPPGGGGQPPVDPAMMGGAGQAAPAPLPATDPNQQPPADPSQQQGAGKPPKADINTIATEVHQLKHMLFKLLHAHRIEVPEETLDPSPHQQKVAEQQPVPNMEEVMKVGEAFQPTRQSFSSWAQAVTRLCHQRQSS